jgi:hypothetical protein
MRSSKLTEGMWKGDLEDIVQPIVSIDEYESKIDSRAIAIGLFVNDSDAADDLNRFIQKSAVPIIDADVSPAPDQRGYYIVFAEFQINDRLAQNIKDLLDEVGHLCNIESWKMKLRGVEGVHPLNTDIITKAIHRNQLGDKIEELRSKVEYLKSAMTKKEKEAQKASREQKKAVAKQSAGAGGHMDQNSDGMRKGDQSEMPARPDPRP